MLFGHALILLLLLGLRASYDFRAVDSPGIGISINYMRLAFLAFLVQF